MFFVYKFCIVVCYITYAYYFISCDIESLCFSSLWWCLCPSLPCFSPFEVIDNEANERCKPLCYTAIRRVPRSAYSHGPKTPTPPYVGTSVNIRPLPIFFEIFLTKALATNWWCNAWKVALFGLHVFSMNIAAPE